MRSQKAHSLLKLSIWFPMRSYKGAYCSTLFTSLFLCAFCLTNSWYFFFALLSFYIFFNVKLFYFIFASAFFCFDVVKTRRRSIKFYVCEAFTPQKHQAIPNPAYLIFFSKVRINQNQQPTKNLPNKQSRISLYI